MSERGVRTIAIGLSSAALLLAATATIVVVRRGSGGGDEAAVDAKCSGSAGAPAPPPKAATIEGTMAADIVRQLRTALSSSAHPGVRLRDRELAHKIGLEDGDVITSLDGVPTNRSADLDMVMMSLASTATGLYAEIDRGGVAVHAHWTIDVRSPYSVPDISLAPPPPPPDPDVLGGNPFGDPRPADPLVDTITKVDDTHVTIPRKTVDALLADPMTSAKGARVVPAIRGGKPDGFKLYAIRPRSFFAALGLQNGDTINAINGASLTTPDSALQAYTKLKDAKSLTLDITRRGRPVSLEIEITP